MTPEMVLAGYTATSKEERWCAKPSGPWLSSCSAVLVAPFAGHAKVIKPPTAALNQKISLTCWIDNNHMLNVGSAHAMRKGTQIYFTAKLENAGTYARTLPLPVTFLRISR